VLRSHRWRTAENSAAYLLPHLRPDHRILDVGCGPGTISTDLARRVPDGAVVGIDPAPDAITAALAARPADLPNVSFQVGDVYALDAPDESFDVVHLHQVLQHLTDPVRALGECRRVLRPGGVLAARDSNYAAFWWAPADPRLDRWLALYHEITAANTAEADAGRFLKGWAVDAGFDDVSYTSSTWTFAEVDDRHWWGGLWHDRALLSSFADQAIDYGLSDRVELESIAAAFTDWSRHDDAVFVIPHGEVIARR
jgi:ubiquinone/menaquinone biosynthesis C-methylase UbiE